MVRALACHNLHHVAHQVCWLRDFSLGTPVFPSPQKPILDLICINLLISVHSVPISAAALED